MQLISFSLIVLNFPLNVHIQQGGGQISETAFVVLLFVCLF